MSKKMMGRTSVSGHHAIQQEMMQNSGDESNEGKETAEPRRRGGSHLCDSASLPVLYEIHTI